MVRIGSWLPNVCIPRRPHRATLFRPTVIIEVMVCGRAHQRYGRILLPSHVVSTLAVASASRHVRTHSRFRTPHAARRTPSDLCEAVVHEEAQHS